MTDVLFIMSCRHAITDVWLLLTQCEAEALAKMINEPTEIASLEGGDPEFSSEDINFRIIDDLKSVEAFKVLSNNSDVWFPMSTASSDCDGSEFSWKGCRFQEYMRTNLHTSLIWHAIYKTLSSIENNSKMTIKYEAMPNMFGTKGTKIYLKDLRTNFAVIIKTKFRYEHSSLRYDIDMDMEMDIQKIKNSINFFSDLSNFQEEFFNISGYIDEVDGAQDAENYKVLSEVCMIDHLLRSCMPNPLMNIILSYIRVDDLFCN
jgi:hypothetical protein